MARELEVTKEAIITVKMSGAYAGQLERSINRALTAIAHLDPKRIEQLVNTHTVDDLSALRTALLNATE